MRELLKEVDQKFNLSLDHHPETLRPVPVDSKDFREAISTLEKALKKPSSLLDRAIILTRAGMMNTIVGSLGKGLDQLIEAENLIPETELRLMLINKTRIASNHQFSGNFEASDKLFNQLLEKVDMIPNELKATILQHSGKNQFDQGNFKLAKDEFERALEIRLSIGNSELVQSTELALAATFKKLNS